jgi:hypothetical protein
MRPRQSRRQNNKRVDAKAKKEYSTAAQKLMVVAKIEHDKRVNGKQEGEGADNIWVDIHSDHLRAMEAEELTTDNNISKEGQQARYDKELAWYRDYCKKIDATLVSGAPRDDIQYMGKILRRRALARIPPCLPRWCLQALSSCHTLLSTSGHRMMVPPPPRYHQFLWEFQGATSPVMTV